MVNKLSVVVHCCVCWVWAFVIVALVALLGVAAHMWLGVNPLEIAHLKFIGPPGHTEL
jgi:hypothetical protein